MLEYPCFATFSGTKASDNKTDFSLILEKKDDEALPLFCRNGKVYENGGSAWKVR